MGKNSHLVKAIIEIDELKPGMKIIEYLGLDVCNIYNRINILFMLFFIFYWLR